MADPRILTDKAMLIRSATLEDTPSIAHLSSQLGYPATSADVTRLYSAMLQHNEHAVFLAEEQDGRVSGWVHVFLARRLFVPTFAELGGIVVDESRRGSGIGRALMAEAEHWAAENGCSLLRIRSNVRRAGSHQFYERVGYTVLKSQTVYDKELSDTQDA